MTGAVDAQHARELVRESIETLGSRMNLLSVSFFTHLFRLEPSLQRVLSGSAVTLNRKFANTMATFKSVRRLESMVPAIESLTKRHFGYGMRIGHLHPFREALVEALAEQLRERFTNELRQAWENVFDEIAGIMMSASQQHPEWQGLYEEQEDPHLDTGLFNEIGGTKVIQRVHARFYDQMFDHPWLGRFFYGKNKEALIAKQTRFMVAAFGGPNEYVGEPPALAHMHMYITEEMALERERVLRHSILAEGLNVATAQRWLKIDRSFWPAINKNSTDECVTKCFGQAPLVIRKPDNYHPPVLSEDREFV